MIYSTYSSVKKASIILEPSGLTANSGISIRSCRLKKSVQVIHIRYIHIWISTFLKAFASGRGLEKVKCQM